MIRVRSLMSPIEAAGYAMAPAEDDIAQDEVTFICADELVYEQPDVALRNGHVAAARSTQRRLPAPKRLAKLPEPSWLHTLRDFFSGWWIGRAAA